MIRNKKYMRDTEEKDTYSLLTNELFLADVNKYVEADNITETDALVRSGQYFATLATKLDRLSDQLKKGNEVQAHHLQEIIDELLFIQQRYSIKKK